jgi:cyclin-dependent kinase 7
MQFFFSEIKLLQELHHPNVLSLYEIFVHHSNIHLVLEYMTGDLEHLIRGLAAQNRSLSHADIKAYIKMILQGMEHTHAQWIMHRDMKVRAHRINTHSKCREGIRMMSVKCKG